MVMAEALAWTEEAKQKKEANKTRSASLESMRRTPWIRQFDALAFGALTQDRTPNAETARKVDTPNLFILPPGTAVRCRPSIYYTGHPVAAHIGLNDSPSSVAG
jgi:hypothetical protein